VACWPAPCISLRPSAGACCVLLLPADGSPSHTPVHAVGPCALTHLLALLLPLPVNRWKSSVLTCHYLEKAGAIVGVRAVALLAGLPEDFKKHCYIGRSQVPVPAAWVNQLLPDIFTLQQQLRTQAQASSKRDLDYSALALTDTLILLAEAVFQGMPFRVQEYGASYALLQLPAVREIVT
jgi:hypothetical protein